MSHCAACRNAVKLVGQRACRACAAADISSPCAENGSGSSLSAARTEFENRPSLSGAHDAVSLGGDKGLVIEHEKHVGFDQLRLDRRGADGENRLVRENGSSLGNSPDVAGEAEAFEVFEKLLVKNALGAEVRDVVIVKVKLFDVVDNLLKTCRNSEAAVVGNRAEKYVELHLALVEVVFEVAVGHGEFIEVTQHSQIFFFHSRLLDIFVVQNIDMILCCVKLQKLILGEKRSQNVFYQSAAALSTVSRNIKQKQEGV